MEGRWVLEGVPDGKWPMVQRGPWLGDRVRVPVVPCDDAAIERAAQGLADAVQSVNGRGRGAVADHHYEWVRAVFRAAGETP